MMHLITTLVVFCLCIVMTISAPYSGDNEEEEEESDDCSPPTTLFEVASGGFCLRRVSTTDAASGFKEWITKYDSGYIVAAKTLYMFYRCEASNTQSRRKRRQSGASGRQRLLPRPRPC
ncbi:hypothetical protein P5673_008843 [Acropora cervicornis]|uniref:Uncharacterized protein n=1 Tax=Acropora cervicornis TaxID=6130 RepID=A0AAD9QT88_ACRCE|nr:hypothetical protein P5673_008843 [Acropora cervicornis]